MRATDCPVKPRPVLPARSPREVAARDRIMREAFLEMRPKLKRDTPGAYLFEGVQGQTARGWVQACTMMELAADHGVPLDRLLAFARAIEGYAYKLDADRRHAAFQRTLGMKLVEEAELDAAADVAQAHLLHQESPSTLRAFLDTGRRHMAHMAELMRDASVRLFHTQQRRA